MAHDAGERARTLNSIFTCGGEVQVAAPLSLRGPEGKQLKVVREILDQVRESLCPHDAAAPRAELHSLNVYGRGGHFIAHKDTPREPSVFDTLVVCLPLDFRGGRLIVEQESRATFDWQRRSSFASFQETEALRIRWAAFFGDVNHRIEAITSGCRATLTYELRRAPDSGIAVARQPSAAEAKLTAALVDALAEPKFVCKEKSRLTSGVQGRLETKFIASTLRAPSAPSQGEARRRYRVAKQWRRHSVAGRHARAARWR